MKGRDSETHGYGAPPQSVMGTTLCLTFHLYNGKAQLLQKNILTSAQSRESLEVTPTHF